MNPETLAKAKDLEERITDLEKIVKNPRVWSISCAGRVLYDGSNGGHINALHARALSECRRVLTDLYERELAKF